MDVVSSASRMAPQAGRDHKIRESAKLLAENGRKNEPLANTGFSPLLMAH